MPVPSLDASDLATWCVAKLGRACPGDPAERFERLLSQMTGGVLLLIDDAEHLPPETASQLARWMTGCNGKLIVVAAAYPGHRALALGRYLGIAHPITLTRPEEPLFHFAEVQERLLHGEPRAPMARVGKIRRRCPTQPAEPTRDVVPDGVPESRGPLRQQRPGPVRQPLPEQPAQQPVREPAPAVPKPATRPPEASAPTAEKSKAPASAVPAPTIRPPKAPAPNTQRSNAPKPAIPAPAARLPKAATPDAPRSDTPAPAVPTPATPAPGDATANERIGHRARPALPELVKPFLTTIVSLALLAGAYQLGRLSVEPGEAPQAPLPEVSAGPVPLPIVRPDLPVPVVEDNQAPVAPAPEAASAPPPVAQPLPAPARAPEPTPVVSRAAVEPTRTEEVETTPPGGESERVASAQPSEPEVLQDAPTSEPVSATAPVVVESEPAPVSVAPPALQSSDTGVVPRAPVYATASVDADPALSLPEIDESGPGIEVDVTELQPIEPTLARRAPFAPPAPPPAQPSGDGWVEVEVAGDRAALVWIDGVSAGSTPVERVDIAPGRHRITLRTGNGARIRRTIEVRPGRGTRLRLQLD